MKGRLLNKCISSSEKFHCNHWVAIGKARWELVLETPVPILNGEPNPPARLLKASSKGLET